MRIYYRGPGVSFTYPLSDDMKQAIIFKRKMPGEKAETVAEEVSDDAASDLLTRKGHNFRTLDPADEERLFPKKRVEGDDTPTPVSPSFPVLIASERMRAEDAENGEEIDKEAVSPGDALISSMETTLPSNSRTVRGAEKKV